LPRVAEVVQVEAAEEPAAQQEERAVELEEPAARLELRERPERPLASGQPAARRRAPPDQQAPPV
jgi:hypothetical protein